MRDYLNGALILIENQFAKGDVVRIAGVAGTVEDFSLRRTTLRDLDGIVHTVPNGEIKVASNLTRVWARINQDVTVAHGTDVDKAIDVVDQVGQEMADDPAGGGASSSGPRVERVEAIGEYGITLKLLGSVRAGEQWATAGELRKRLLAVPRERHRDPPAAARRPVAGSRPDGVRRRAEVRTRAGPVRTEHDGTGTAPSKAALPAPTTAAVLAGRALGRFVRRTAHRREQDHGRPRTADGERFPAYRARQPS